jgi:hypothetical protein
MVGAPFSSLEELLNTPEEPPQEERLPGEVNEKP